MTIPPLNSVRVLAVDFDGTLFDRTTGKPYPDAIESLRQARNWGYEVVIYSARASKPESAAWIRDFLAEHGFRGAEVTNVKPPRLSWLVDDRAIPFERNWPEIIESIRNETFPWKR